MKLEKTGQFVWGLPKNWYNYSWRYEEFKTIIDISQRNIIRAFQNYLSCKREMAQDKYIGSNHYHIDHWRNEVNGLLRLYLAMVEEHFNLELQRFMYVYG